MQRRLHQCRPQKPCKALSGLRRRLRRTTGRRMAHIKLGIAVISLAESRCRKTGLETGQVLLRNLQRFSHNSPFLAHSVHLSLSRYNLGLSAEHGCLRIPGTTSYYWCLSVKISVPHVTSALYDASLTWHGGCAPYDDSEETGAIPVAATGLLEDKYAVSCLRVGAARSQFSH